MNHLLIAAAFLAASTAGSSVAHSEATDVDPSALGEPGFYGRLDLGDFGNPSVINARPSLDRRPLSGEINQPLYVRVPSSHRKDWHKHCAIYVACEYPVYFVKEDWYRNVYAPYYRNRHREDRAYRDDREDKDLNNRGGRDDREWQQGDDNDPGKGRDTAEPSERRSS